MQDPSFRMLLTVQQHHARQLAESPFDDLTGIRLLDAGLEEQVCLFDSMVFHAISMFDYFGNVIDYICGGKREMRLKWNGALKSAYDKNNSISNSPVASVIITLHKEFVDRLYQHRSDLIHYKPDSGASETSIDLMNDKSGFVVFAPKKIVHLFHELREQSASNKLTIKYVAFWVCKQTLESAHQLIGPLLKHINDNRKTPPGRTFLFVYHATISRAINAA